MRAGLRFLCALGSLLAFNPALADALPDGAGDKIAAHFEALSSRLVADDTQPLAQFVAKAEKLPGARLAVLVPATHDPAQSRFVAARVAELVRRIRSLVETAEFHTVAGNVGADLLWLVIIPPTPEASREIAAPVALLPPQPVESETLPSPAKAPVTVPATAADLQLSDWVIRGVKHPPQGPAHAYVAKAGPGEIPHEIIEQQTDKELGLVKDISQTPDGAWIVHTEIGWIGQAPSPGSFGAGGH